MQKPAHCICRRHVGSLFCRQGTLIIPYEVKNLPNFKRWQWECYHERIASCTLMSFAMQVRNFGSASWLVIFRLPHKESQRRDQPPVLLLLKFPVYKKASMTNAPCLVESIFLFLLLDHTSFAFLACAERPGLPFYFRSWISPWFHLTSAAFLCLSFSM